MIHLATDQDPKTGEAPEAAAWRFEEKYADAEVRTVTDGRLLAVVHAGPEQQRILRALKLAASVDGQSATIFIDFKQASDILSMFGGEPGEVTLQLGEGHSGRGLYAHYTEYPEEGAEFLGATDQEAVPVADASEAAEPLTRFCPGCGSVGLVEAKFRDCCPDGSDARMIPEKLAAKCRDLFRAALDGALTQREPAQQEAAEPMFYASQQQAEALQDPPGENERGVYLPLRKTSAGMFTMPLYCALAPGPQEASAAARDVLAERRRQVEAEGWTTERDDEHADGSLARAAACYALGHASLRAPHAADMILWPWELASWKPTYGRRDLVRSGALILAEIERLDRSALQPTQDAR